MSSAEPSMRLVDRSRGVVLGLLLGDALATAGSQESNGSAPLRSTCAAQLACFTVEGIIRASVRQAERGICHPPSVVWHALIRWAHIQGMAVPEAKKQFAPPLSDTAWPDGWLAQVPAMALRRGSAPATVAALQAGRMGTREHAASVSTGYHGLVRALPFALAIDEARSLFEMATDTAALTHGAPDGFITAAHGALILRRLLDADHAVGGLRAALDDIRAIGDAPHHLDSYDAAIADALNNPGDPALLQKHGHDLSATSALQGAVYVVASFPGREQLGDAVAFAAAAPGGGVATTTGALLGGLHGVSSLPVAAVSRLELAWVGDTLARDLATELAVGPSGHEVLIGSDDGTLAMSWHEGPDPHWWTRYPGS